MLPRIIITLICVIYFGSCSAQTDNTSLTNWHSYPVPTNKDSINKLGFAPIDWVVFMQDNEVHVIDNKLVNYSTPLPFEVRVNKSEQKDFRGKPSVLKVDDGYLIGFFAGEWGGCLYWFSSDGKQHYKISNDEIVQFVQRDHKSYAIQELAHLEISKGSIISIEKHDGKWGVNEYVQLPSAPEAITLDAHNNFIVITSKSLFKIDVTKKVVPLVEKGIWYASLYPTSILIKNNIAYMGMRKGVFKYNLNTGKQEWLLKN